MTEFYPVPHGGGPRTMTKNSEGSQVEQELREVCATKSLKGVIKCLNDACRDHAQHRCRTDDAAPTLPSQNNQPRSRSSTKPHSAPAGRRRRRVSKEPLAAISQNSVTSTVTRGNVMKAKGLDTSGQGSSPRRVQPAHSYAAYEGQDRQAGNGASGMDGVFGMLK
jgi:hypothetical protein